MNRHGHNLNDALTEHEGVLSTSQVLRFMSAGQLRWQLSSGRWQQPGRGVVVAQSGPLTSGFPAWLVRSDPECVASKIREALRRAGYQG